MPPTPRRRNGRLSAPAVRPRAPSRFRRGSADDRVTTRPFVVFQFQPATGAHGGPHGDVIVARKVRDEWSALKDSLPDVRIRRLFSSLPEEEVDALVAKAALLDPGYRLTPEDFRGWFRFPVAEWELAERAAKTLRASPLVRTSYVEQVGPDPGVSIVGETDYPSQGYLQAAPEGIDAVHAWTKDGGDGARQVLADVERGWARNHPDLVDHGIPAPEIGVDVATWRPHGTAVLGIACATDESNGCIGVAPHVGRIRLFSIARAGLDAGSPDAPGDDSNIADTILNAAGSLRPGDILLLETQIRRPFGGQAQVLVPVEVSEANRNAIHTATSLGVVVVEAGGNGYGGFSLANGAQVVPFDLDAYQDGGKAILDPADPAFLDSGAILVSAASSVVPHVRLPTAPTGRRIDCYAWGDSVVTCAADTNGDSLGSMNNFGHTSAAAAIVAGAALSAQGMIQSRFGVRAWPPTMRQLLRTHGTLPQSGVTTEIGVMPDLRAIAETGIPALPFVHLRDLIRGARDAIVAPVLRAPPERDPYPETHLDASSPDLIFRMKPDPAPQEAWGAGSGHEDDPDLSQDLRRGGDRFVYVRLFNRGASDATDVGVTLVAVPARDASRLSSWRRIGRTIVKRVPKGNVATLSEPVTWRAQDIPSSSGRWTVFALVESGLASAAVPKSAGGAFSAVRTLLRRPDLAARTVKIV